MLYAVAFSDTGYIICAYVAASDAEVNCVAEAAVLHHVPRSFETGGNDSIGVGSEWLASGKILVV